MRTNSSKNRESGDGEDWNSKGGKYGFYREYKLEPSDRWTETNPTAFKAFELKAERYLLSAKPQYAEGIKELMTYVQTKEQAIELKETDQKGNLVLQESFGAFYIKPGII